MLVDSDTDYDYGFQTPPNHSLTVDPTVNSNVCICAVKV